MGALEATQGVDYGKDPHVTNLVASIFREKPHTTRYLPAWGLGLVLKLLLKTTFEPLQLTDKK